MFLKMIRFILVCVILSIGSVVHAKEKEKVNIEALTEKANEGDRQAQYDLGMLYYTGREVERNLELGAQWFLKAAQQGLAEAQFAVGRCYFFGQGVPRDKATGAGWYYESALQDNPQGIYSLAECFYMGEGVEKNHSEAINWYSKAAAKGDRGAQFSIARILEKGDPSVRNPQKALAEYKKSARDGDAHAEYLVGTFYEEAKGVPRDMSKAIRSYKDAAKDSELARVKLAVLSSRGDGVERNPVEAYMWLELSKLTVENDPATRELKKELEANLTPEQIELAKAEADKFTKQHNIEQESLVEDFGY